MIMTSLDWVEGCSDSRTLEEHSRPTPLKHLPPALRRRPVSNIHRIRCDGKIAHSSVPGARARTSTRGAVPLPTRCKRYGCHGGKRTFNDLTNTLLHQSKRSLSLWMLATFLLCLACSSRRIAREVGVHSRTSYRWCWWLRHAALSYEMHRQLAGTVEADDLSHTAGQKGQAPHGGKKALGRRARGRRKPREPGRGPYDKDRRHTHAWVSRQGAVVIQATRDSTVQTVQRPRTLRCTRAVGSPRTRPAAIGR